jgi:predicted enzyme related to lactoylglutathione lyase
MSNADIRGRFVWHELMTTDTKAAGAFYPKVTNWKTQTWDKDPSYTMWAVAKGPFGGLRPLPDAARASGPHWLPYVGTADVDATVQTAQGLGGRVYMGATEIPDTGRFAVLADPQGAVFAIFSLPATPASGGGGSMPQEFSWHELATSDPVGALRFYAALFGWAEIATHDMGAAGAYHLVGLGGVASIGMWKTTADKPMPPHWLCYAHVADIDKSANAAKAAGGKLLNGPMEVPGGTWIAHLTDPQGAAFALHADKRVAVAATTPQPPKAAAPKNVSAPPGAKPQPPTLKAPASTAAASATAAKPQAPATVSAPATKAAASPTSAAKTAAAKKTPARKAAAKKAPAKKVAARKTAAKKSRSKKRPQKKSKRVAKKVARKAAVKRKGAKKRGRASKRRGAPGRLEVARRFAAKQADSILKRLRGKKRR